MVETVSDYAGFDFAGLWKGREKVTEVERSILARSLEGIDHRRLLEVGTGFGRLLGCLTAAGQEVVALDFDAGALARVRRGSGERPPYLWVAANLYHLPFVDGAFTGATMIRVYHHLDDPVAALGEVGRVLQEGARLIVSYTPKPSVGTLVTDVQRALRSPREPPFRSVTFSRQPSIELSGETFPVIVSSRARFAQCVRAAGFELETDQGAGLEEYRVLRGLPSAYFVRWAETIGRAPAFPLRFAQLRVHRSRHPPFPPGDRILACPRCRTALDSPADPVSLVCPQCSFTGERRNGVIDLRYLPEGTRRRSPGVGVTPSPK